MTAAAISCSPMSISDYQEVYQLWTSVDGLRISNGDSMENLNRYLQRNPGMSFIARCNGELVGTVLCGHDGLVGMIHHLAVAPAHRNLGIASKLVQSALGALNLAGIERCQISVGATNAVGRSFWRKLGWGRGKSHVYINNQVEALELLRCNAA